MGVASNEEEAVATLSETELLALLGEPESDRVEFKESLSGSARTAIREAICSFANDLPHYRQPGVIVVGVKDDGSVAGFSATDDELLTLSDMKTDGNILPLPSMTVERRHILGKEVAVVVVHPSDSPPVRYRGRIHVRVGPRRGIATPQDERLLNEKRRHRDMPFDLQAVPSATLRDLDLVRFEQEYLPQAFAVDVLEANQRTMEERLAATKMTASADDPTPTVLGLLVLGKSPQDFLPGAYVQFLRSAGTNETDPVIDSADIRGAIPDIIRRLDEKLMAHNSVAVDILSGPLERRTSLFPLDAIQQITRNALLHRTYESTNAPVHVYWFSDGIQVSSPGGPFGIVSSDNFGHPGVIDYRNPNLADAMRTLGFVQRFGFGIQIARRLLQESGHPDLEFDISNNLLLVKVLPAAAR